MKYFRRYNPDGSCRIICLRCFATIATAKDSPEALDFEHQHVCARQHRSAPQQKSTGNFRVIKTFLPAKSSSVLNFVARLPRPDVALLLMLTLLLLYGFPTIIEVAALQLRIPTIAVILFGDLVACAFLSTILRMRNTGVSLYLALSLCEIGFHSTGTLPCPFLPWILDLFRP
jgi:hypothetical protein